MLHISKVSFRLAASGQPAPFLIVMPYIKQHVLLVTKRLLEPMLRSVSHGYCVAKSSQEVAARSLVLDGHSISPNVVCSNSY